MTRTPWFAAVAFVLGAAAAVLVLVTPVGRTASGRLFGRPAGAPEAGGVASPGPAGPATGQRAIKYWRAPMDPTYIRDAPGKSPMGMDLVPVYEGDDEAAVPGLVHIDPTFVQNIGVQSEPIRRTDIPFTVRTVGTLTYDDGQSVWVTTKYDGFIERVWVNYVGEPVRKGQRLFDIYSPALVTTQNEYLQALDFARRLSGPTYQDAAARAWALVASSRQRLAYWDITPAQIDELERSRTVRRTLSVVSPADGLVAAKMDQALEGVSVKAGMNLYKIVDLSRIWVQAEIYEHQVPWLAVGQRATVDVPYDPGTRLTGRVRYVLPFFSEQTRTMKVSIELPNPGRRLRADMYAYVTFEVPAARGVLAAPEEAVIHSGTRDVVVLDRGHGTFQVRDVTLGVNGAGVWEIKHGVAEGDLVVVSAQFLIDSESSLKEAIRQLTGPDGGTPSAPAGHEGHEMPGETPDGMPAMVPPAAARP